MTCQSEFTGEEITILDYLIGRGWTLPSSIETLRDDLAVRLCDELVVKEMLERVPGGRYRLRGDCGWF